MGAADAEEDERPVHRVYVSEFFIGRFPVTNDEYARFVRATGHPSPAVGDLPLITIGGREALFRESAAPYVWDRDQPPAGHGSHPVVLVRYDDALAYCEWLSQTMAGRCGCRPRRSGRRRRARAARVFAIRGATTSTPRAETISSDAPARPQRGTRPTGTYPPNAYGLYDVCGNVWEWVSDWYGADYYGLGDNRDPRGPQSANMRIVRGGSWLNDDVVDAAVRLPAQGAARHLRLQHRIQDRMRSVKKPVSSQPSALSSRKALSPQPSAPARRRATPRLAAI